LKETLGWFKTVLLSLFLFFNILMPADAALGQSILLSDISVTDLPQKTRLVITTTQPVLYTSFTLNNPPRLILDLAGEDIYSQKEETIVINKGMIKSVRNNYYQNGIDDKKRLDLIVIEFTQSPQYKITTSGNSIFVDVDNPKALSAVTGTNLGTVTFKGPKLKKVKVELEQQKKEVTKPISFVPSLPKEEAKVNLPTVEEVLKTPTVILEKPSLSPKILTLKESIDIALANSEEIKIAQEEIKLAKLKVREANRALYPAASLKWQEETGASGSGAEDFRGREFAMDLQQSLADGGVLRNSLKQAQVNLEIAQKSYDKVKSEVIFDTKQAYYNLAVAQLNYRNQQQALKDVATILDSSQKELKNELITQIEFLAVKSQYNQVNNQLASYEKEFSLAQLNLRQILNFKSEQPLAVEDIVLPTPLTMSLEEYLNFAYRTRPEIKISQLTTVFSDYGRKIAEGQGRPKISLTGSGGFADEAFESQSLQLGTEWYLGLKVTAPWGGNTVESATNLQKKKLSQGFTSPQEVRTHTLTLSLLDNLKYFSDKKMAFINYQKSLEEYTKTREGVEMDVRRAYFSCLKSLNQMESLKEQLLLDEKEIKVKESLREINEAETSEVLGAKIKWWSDRSSFFQEQGNYYIALANLEKAIGLTDYSSLALTAKPKQGE
jgi:outer membrane protein TolC